MSAPPSTEEVRRLFVYGGWEEGRHQCDEDAIDAEFDRWLVAHDADVRADERTKIAAAILDEMVCCTREDSCRPHPNMCHWGRHAAEIAERAS